MDLQELAKAVSLLYKTLYTPASPQQKLWEEHLMIRDTLKSIVSAQQHKFDQFERSADHLEAFLKWCDQVKIDHNLVEVVPFKNHDGFGLKAKKEIPKETDVVTIPRAVMIDVERIRKVPEMIRPLTLDPLIVNNQNMAVAIFLISERLKKSSSLAPYINFLPSTNSIPLFFSQEDFQKLKPSPCYEEALIFYRSIARQYCHFLLEVIKKTDFESLPKEEREKEMKPIFSETPFTVDNFTWDIFCWGVSTVTCRCNSIPNSVELDENGKAKILISMIPFLDLANHNNKIENSCAICYNLGTKSAVLTSTKEYSPGDTVEMFYGKRTTAEYMIHNGFVPRGGIPSDSYELRLNFAKNDPIAAAKIIRFDNIESHRQWKPSHVKKYQIRTYAFMVSNGEDPIPENLKLFVRLFNAQSLDETTMRSKELERKTAEWLKNRFQILLMGYRHSEYKEGREKIIEELHLCEQKILKNAFDFASKWLAEIQEEIQTREMLEKRYKKKTKQK